MLALIVSVHFFGVTGKTELPDWLGAFLDARYSEEAFILPILIGFILSLLVTLLFNTPNISHIEKLRLGKFFNGLAYIIRNLLMFFSGWLFAWSFGSFFVDFIEPIPQQEILVPFILIIAVVSNYYILKYKHYKIKGPQVA
jgi:hypothetical protein